MSESLPLFAALTRVKDVLCAELIDANDTGHGDTLPRLTRER
jgi:hypothetical protein